jgi:hypothetical protein
MSAVNSTSFTNRKPKLDGDLTKSVGTTAGSVAGNLGGLSSIDGADHLRGTMIVTVTEAVNLVILRFSQYATNDSNIEIRESANVLAVADGSVTGTRTINLVLENVSVGAHTYTCFTVFDGTIYQYAQANPGGTVLYGAPVDIADTHSTKNANIISG